MATRRGPFSGGSSGGAGRAGPFSGTFKRTATKAPATEPTTTEKMESVAKQNERLRGRLTEGIGPSVAEQIGAVETGQRGLMWVLNQISRPFYGVAGYLHGATKKGGGISEGLREAGRGLALKETHDFGEVLTNLGWEPKSSFGKGAKAGASFIGNVAIDPASYVTGGTKGIAETALERALRGTLKEAGRELPEAALRNTVRELAVVAEAEAGKRAFTSTVAREVASEAAERLGDKTLRGPVEEALLRVRPSRTAEVGFNLWPSKKRLKVGAVSLERPGEALTRGLERAGAKAGESPVGRALLELGGKTKGILGKAFVVDAGQSRRVANLGRGYRDLTRADKRLIFEDTRNLARDFETTLRETPPEALRPPKASVTTGAMRGLHGAGKKAGLGHEELRGLATDLFGVKSLTELSDEQARGLRQVLRDPDFGKKPPKDLLPATAPVVAEEISPSYAIMRAVDSTTPGAIDALPAPLQPYAREAKATFDEMGATEKAIGALDETRENYFTHIMTGYEPEEMDQLQNAMAKWRAMEEEIVQAERATAKKTFLAEEMAKGVASPAARAKWQERLSKLPKQTRFAKKRTLETFDDLERFVRWAKDADPALKNLAVEKDFVKVLALRKLAHSRVMRDYDMLSSLRNLGDDLVMDAKTAPAHFVESPVPQLAGVKVSPEVAQWLRDFKEPFTNISTLKKVLAVLVDLPTDIWAGLATAPRPGFHIRNALSNIFNNWLAGVRDIGPYLDAARLQKAAAKGPEALRALRVGGRDGEAVWRELIERGVVGQGWLGADVRQSLEEALRGGRGQRGGALRQALAHPVIEGRRYGMAIEDNARVAHYLAKTAEGLPPETAALSVKAALFDYDELTAFERNVLKRVWRFYTWSRKNIPYQFSMLLQQPGVYTKLGHFKRAVESLSTGPGEEELPDWMRKTYSIRLPWQTERGQLYANIDLPLTDLVLPSGREILGMLAPLPRIIGESITNQQFYSGRPIEEAPGEYVEAPGYIWALEYGARVLPGWEKIRPSLGLAEVVNPDTGEKELRMPAKVRYLADQLVFLRDIGRGVGVLGGQAPVEQIGSPLLGVGLSSLDEERNRLNQEYEMNRILRGIKAREESKGVVIPEAPKAPKKAPAPSFNFQRGGKSKRRGPFSGG